MDAVDAVRITNAKLRGILPTQWRTFRGVSVLYDAPGCAELSGLQPLSDLARSSAHDDELYTRLWAISRVLDEAAGDADVPVAWLPRESYHVTLCDAVHDGAGPRVAAEAQDDVRGFLDGLPDSLLWYDAVMRTVREPQLAAAVWRDPVTFRVEHLEVRGHALLASLGPDDPPSAVALGRHREARSAFAARLHAVFGLETDDLHPHLTLGYLADDEDAQRMHDEVLGPWRDETGRHLRGATVRFRSAAPYGFTDMVSFHRLGR